MIRQKFTKYCEEKGLSTQHATGIGYVNSFTEACWQGFKAAYRIQGEVLANLGICGECDAPFVEIWGPDNSTTPDPDYIPSMMCDCTIDMHRDTLLIKKDQEIHKLNRLLDIAFTNGEWSPVYKEAYEEYKHMRDQS
jgi:hypothetical protein